MSVGKYKQEEENSAFPKELFAVYLTDAMLFDKLHEIAGNYTLPVERLVNLAVKRLVEDVEFVQSLRKGDTEGA